MENNKFGLDTTIQGKDAVAYMASLIERNEAQQIEIERGKLAVSILKQMNNRSRLLIDAAKYELKRQEADAMEKAKAEA
jgi:hypothetical protein